MAHGPAFDCGKGAKICVRMVRVQLDHAVPFDRNRISGLLNGKTLDWAAFRRRTVVERCQMMVKNTMQNRMAGMQYQYFSWDCNEIQGNPDFLDEQRIMSKHAAVIEISTLL
ncbi:MAG: hypothetical protein AAF269_15735 [Pseudomonadota bacterium]